MKPKPLLADIGNTHFHIYDGHSVEHLSHEEALRKYAQHTLYYICVKHDLDEKIKSIPSWKNISSQVVLDGAYETMGVDRKALCLSHDAGVFVDAGSAITVDVMHGGKYVGGYIVPGLHAMQEAYADISPVLQTQLNKTVSLQHLPLTTKDGISYGIIASIKALIDVHRKDKKLYVTGGDGKFLSHFLEDAIYDEMLVFYGMQKVMKDIDKC